MNTKHTNVEKNLHTVYGGAKKMLKADLPNDNTNYNTLEGVEQLKPVKKRKRKQKTCSDHANLSKEELEKLRREADAQRKKNRRLEMTWEEREAFRKSENERKRRARLEKSYDVQRAKENQRKKEKRAAMTPEERKAFLERDAARKRLERKKRREKALENKNNAKKIKLEATVPTQIQVETVPMKKEIKIEFAEDMIKNIKTTPTPPTITKKLGRPPKRNKHSNKPNALEINHEKPKSKDIVEHEMSTMIEEMMNFDSVTISAEEAKKNLLKAEALILPYEKVLDADQENLNGEALVLPWEVTDDDAFNAMLEFDSEASKTLSLAGSTSISEFEQKTIIVSSVEKQQSDPSVMLEFIDDSIVLLDDMNCSRYEIFDSSCSHECKSLIPEAEQNAVQVDETTSENLVIKYLPDQRIDEMYKPLDENVSIILPVQGEKKSHASFGDNFVITVLSDEENCKMMTSLTENVTKPLIVKSQDSQLVTSLDENISVSVLSELERDAILKKLIENTSTTNKTNADNSLHHEIKTDKNMCNNLLLDEEPLEDINENLGDSTTNHEIITDINLSNNLLLDEPLENNNENLAETTTSNDSTEVDIIPEKVEDENASNKLLSVLQENACSQLSDEKMVNGNQCSVENIKILPNPEKSEQLSDEKEGERSQEDKKLELSENITDGGESKESNLLPSEYRANKLTKYA